MMNKKTLFSKPITTQKGFTLLEMLVVLVIIGLLAGLVGPKLFIQVDGAKVKTTGTQVKMLKGVLETMRLDIGRFPTTEEGLNLLRAAPIDEAIKPFWKGPYLDDVLPLDPWKRSYQYAKTPSVNGQPFVLYSFGADGQAGGEEFDADIGYLPAQ
ncbi:type II secretion system major pseudopilin GspG [Candidatus Albibeggiatoa sp. nov. BB20]|uniref:type II secretion system major pseudopilin GspG n=1 Tax=Candidatus Albibeggiatoa sp. nov. BB20 TaxID=3162723 RepID=UPI0033659C95